MSELLDSSDVLHVPFDERQGSFDELTYKYTRIPQTETLILHCAIKILALGLFEGDHESLRPDDLCISSNVRTLFTYSG